MKATERIKLKESQRLYRKINGRFRPADDPWVYHGLMNGWWLIRVSDGCVSIREQVHPDRSELDAAANELEGELIGIIRKATEARPSKTHLTPEEKQDWDWFIKKHGEGFNTLHYPSFAESTKQIVDAILNRKNK